MKSLCWQKWNNYASFFFCCVYKWFLADFVCIYIHLQYIYNIGQWYETTEERCPSHLAIPHGSGSHFQFANVYLSSFRDCLLAATPRTAWQARNPLRPHFQNGSTNGKTSRVLRITSRLCSAFAANERKHLRSLFPQSQAQRWKFKIPACVTLLSFARAVLFYLFTNATCHFWTLGERLVGRIHLLEEPQPHHGQQ